MLARTVFLLIAALSAGTGIGVHVDGADLGFWLMSVAGFFGSWAFFPFSLPLRRRAPDNEHGSGTATDR